MQTDSAMVRPTHPTHMMCWGPSLPGYGDTRMTVERGSSTRAGSRWLARLSLYAISPGLFVYALFQDAPSVWSEQLMFALLPLLLFGIVVTFKGRSDTKWAAGARLMETAMYLVVVGLGVVSAQRSIGSPGGAVVGVVAALAGALGLPGIVELSRRDHTARRR